MIMKKLANRLFVVLACCLFLGMMFTGCELNNSAGPAGTATEGASSRAIGSTWEINGPVPISNSGNPPWYYFYVSGITDDEDYQADYFEFRLYKCYYTGTQLGWTSASWASDGSNDKYYYTPLPEGIWTIYFRMVYDGKRVKTISKKIYMGYQFELSGDTSLAPGEQTTFVIKEYNDSPYYNYTFTFTSDSSSLRKTVLSGEQAVTVYSDIKGIYALTAHRKGEGTDTRNDKTVRIYVC